MKNSLVSIIIPVYNSETYLEACILSVINQTYSNIEIILINDGSTDGSLQILKKYALADPRIILIDALNEGPALARKKGLDMARGEYIQFLDSDDTLLNDAIELLIKKAQIMNADIVALPFFFCDSDKAMNPSGCFNFIELNGVAYLREILNHRGYWSLWSNFQKRSLYFDFDLEIVPGVFFGEDALWMMQILLRDPKVVSIDKPLLCYNRNLMSLSYNESILAARYQSFRQFQIWMEEYIDRKGFSHYFKKDLAFQHMQTTFTSIRWRQLQDVRSDMARIICDVKQYPDLKKRLSRRECKVIAYYRFSYFLGDYYLSACMNKGKI